ncbi:unnamed protein product [Phytophthora fragariaefolia]|uniref:Unnamed protein product n=1 Tax=Phytophthora fragariaefolia TaxID=1490495 RepID=A0A9W6XX20_9STRA|nr:unnamed protein product [Phytophthora fragariaefolia]
MPKSTNKGKKAQRAVKATPKVSDPRTEKSLPKKTSTTETAPSAKPTRRSKASKRTEVRLPGPYVEPAASESDTDTPNPDLITGDEGFGPATATSRAPKPGEDPVASAKSAASDAPTPAEAPQGQSPPQEDGPDPVDYEESEPDQDREQGETTDPNSSPQLTEQQRVTHSGSPMTPKTAAAVARVEAQVQRESHRDTASTDMLEQPIITNAGIDEGVLPEQLQPDNRRHLSERTQQEASQAAGTKREREASTPRTREQLLALRYWTLNEYREHLRLSRRPGPGVS